MSEANESDTVSEANESDTVSEAKRRLRADMRAVRARVENHRERSTRLCERVTLACDVVSAARTRDRGASLTVMVFNGTGSEPDTTELIVALEARGRALLLPRVEHGEIAAVRHVSGDPLRPGPFGIGEPIGPAVDPADIDVVVVPGLAFTRDGRRLGQGGGFYDRFLPRLRSDCVTIGVGFTEQLVDDLPTTVDDARLGQVIFDAVQE